MSPTVGQAGTVVTFTGDHLPRSVTVRFFAARPVTAAVTTAHDGLSQVITISVPGDAETGLVSIAEVGSDINAGHFTILVRSRTDAEPDSSGRTTSVGAGNVVYPPQSAGRSTSGPSPKSSVEPDLDLPLEAPVFVPPSQRRPKAPPPPPPPPRTIVPPEVPPSIYGKDIKSESGSIVYVIDISGSMSWDEGQYVAADGKVKAGNRLDRAKAELTRSITSLPKGFKFNVMSYDCSYYVCFNNYGNSEILLLPVNDANKSKAIEWVGGLQPGGATGTGPAMTAALNYAPSNSLYVILTDGAPNCGAGSGFSEDSSCLAAHLSQVFWANQVGSNGRKARATINVFGISATGAFKQFCQNVASQNGGSYTDVR